MVLRSSRAERRLGRDPGGSRQDCRRLPAWLLGSLAVRSQCRRRTSHGVTGPEQPKASRYAGRWPRHPGHSPAAKGDFFRARTELGSRRRHGRRHRPHPGGGRRREGRQRTPRHRDEPRAGRLPALPEGHAARPERQRVDRARPLHPLGRALVADAVRAALPGRLRPRARRPQGAAYLGLTDPRSPGVRPHRRSRDHDRPARPGPLVGRRVRLRAAFRARPVRPGGTGRHEPVRPPHLRHRVGR